MFVQGSTSSAPTLNASQNAKSEVIRRSANYHPSIWGDCFIIYNSDNMRTNVHMEEQIDELKEEVRAMLKSTADNPSLKMKLIEALQRLGVAYHFETEIEEALQQLYDTHLGFDTDDDLDSIALRFRLLRQQGYNVPSDVFNKFKDKDGDFKATLLHDVPGMLSLYEATHLRVHGEDILDEVHAFTTTHLMSMVTHLSSPLAIQVTRALNQPLHKGMPRLEARNYISMYQEDKWWKYLDFSSKLPFARNRIVECYFWILGVYFEPQYFLARRILSKVISITATIDDIYDVHGTVEELQLFTEAIERWDISTIDQLPEYMKVCYSALLDIYDEMEEEMTKEGRSYRVNYAKEQMKFLVRAYFVESKWFQGRHIPTMEEYMRVALTSSGYPMLATTSFVGMGEIVTREAFDWVVNEPKIVQASAIIARLMDDLVSHKRGHSASSVECYMKQHGVSEQEVHIEFHKRVTNAWKDVNEECLKQTVVPMPLLMRVLNLARMIHVIYKDEDGLGRHLMRGEWRLDFQEEMTKEGISYHVYYANAWKDINEACLKPIVVPMPPLMRVLNFARMIHLIFMDDDGYTNAHIVLKDYIILLLVDPMPI
ncbi:hypothetical protein HHK36_023758 [Tetracentron sinense]|uniref:Uncharacterized protein n=1 Tax=Tetracentron sinense TaxID=13715 RepID=A0A835D5P2_TETSI|nr:hypothetical protein HHK36_023758 [Tetracentron sinense]